MPDWSSPDELAKDSEVFDKFMHAMLGLYLWEWAISLDYDWQILTGKKPFKWPVGFYLANRYLLLGAMIGIAIGLDNHNEMDCQALYTYNQLTGDSALGLASVNLSIRTIAVLRNSKLYSNSKWIIGFLVVMILGHWSLILQGVFLKASWDPVNKACVIEHTDNTMLAATFMYAMAFDLVVFLLNVWAIVIRPRSIDRTIGMSRLSKLLFRDGLLYFIIACLANTLASTFMILNLNPIMNVIFNVPAAVACTIVACRAVRRLSNFGSQYDAQGPEVFAPSPLLSSSITFSNLKPTNTSVRFANLQSVKEQEHEYELESSV